MSFRNFQLVLVLLAGSIYLPIEGTVETLDELRAIEKAHAAVSEIEADFRRALDEALAKGALERALPGCRVKSPNPEEISVGRTSHRLRNPKNAPPSWTKPYLEKFSKAKRSNIPKHELVHLGNRRYGYLQPIFMEGICLNCHGRSVDKGVQEALRSKYPKDEAIGFDEGDFRGLLWLEMKQK